MTHDSSTYDLLDNQTNITSWTIPNSSSITELDYNEYFISNTEWYQKYILHITDVSWSSNQVTTLEVGAGALDGTGGAQGTAHSYYSHSKCQIIRLLMVQQMRMMIVGIQMK